MKYAEIDKNGDPVGFYADEIHGKNIPAGAVEISEADWQAHLDGDLRQWDGSAWVKYTYVPTLAEVQEAKIAALHGDYLAAVNAGVAYQDATFQCDDASEAKLNSVLTAISNGWTLPAGFTWRDAANVDHPVDAVWLSGLAQAMADNNAALYFRLQKAKDAVRAATTTTDVNVVTF